MMKTLLKLFKIPRNRRGILIEAYLYTGIARIMVLAVPIKFINRYLMKDNNLLGDYKASSVADVQWAIEVAIRHTFWSSKCLVQSLVARRMLKKRGVPSTLYFGVKYDGYRKLQAHSWTIAGNVIVTGGAGMDLKEFTIVGKVS